MGERGALALVPGHRRRGGGCAGGGGGQRADGRDGRGREGGKAFVERHRALREGCSPGRVQHLVVGIDVCLSITIKQSITRQLRVNYSLIPYFQYYTSKSVKYTSNTYFQYFHVNDVIVTRKFTTLSKTPPQHDFSRCGVHDDFGEKRWTPDFGELLLMAF